MSEKKLYYCPECSHVYFNFPVKGICTICGNEISSDEFVKENDLLKCETCHSLYSPSSPEDFLPNPNLNEKYLCACKNNCPTQSVLQIKTDNKGYVGNIIIASPFQCSNCKAILFRGFEERHKECTVCKSKFLTPIAFDSEVEKIFYKCANPNHSIRLKLRDILIHTNKIVSGRLLPIKKKEEALIVEYMNKKAEINARPDGFFGKNFQAKQKAILDLDLWAKKERFQLFDMAPLPARCAVYKEDPKNPKEMIKADGCDAIIELNVRRVVDTDTKSTQIKRKPVPTDQNAKLIPGTVNDSSPIASDSVTENSVNEEEVVPSLEESPLRTMIIHHPLKSEEIQTSTVNPLENIELPSDQIVGKVILNVIDENSDTPSIPINYGLFSIEINKKGKQFRFGRQTLLKSYWSNPDYFVKNPFMFDNITPISSKDSQFKIEWKGDGFYLIPDPQAFNKLYRKNIDGTMEIVSNPELITTNDIFEIHTYYALDKETIEIPHRYAFQISFKLPINSKSLIGAE